MAKTLIQKLLQGGENYYNVIIISCLFPDNAAAATENVGAIGSTANIGRYSFSTAADPNRQMPSPGQPFDEGSGKDHLGREIEKENQLLLRLINVFKPERIANIHAIRDMNTPVFMPIQEPTVKVMHWVLKLIAASPLKWHYWLIGTVDIFPVIN